MRLIYCIVALLVFHHFIVAAPATSQQPAALIVLFIKSMPDQKQDQLHTLTQPASVSRLILKNQLQYAPYRGIYATYAGFVTHSDANGQITFPRKSLTDDLTLIITPRPEPLVTHGNTVQKMFVPEELPAAYYQLQRTQDPQAKITYWITTPLPIPKDRAIPGLALVILENPRHIIVPQESIVTMPGPTLYLPPIYATHDIDTAVTALSFLKISRYFALVNKAYQTGDDRYASVIVP